MPVIDHERAGGAGDARGPPTVVLEVGLGVGRSCMVHTVVGAAPIHRRIPAGTDKGTYTNSYAGVSRRLRRRRTVDSPTYSYLAV